MADIVGKVGRRSPPEGPYDMEIIPRVAPFNISIVNHANSPFNRYHAKGLRPLRVYLTVCIHALRCTDNVATRFCVRFSNLNERYGIFR